MINYMTNLSANNKYKDIFNTAKDGSVIWTEQHNTPIYNDQGHLIAIEGIARDVTDRIKMESELLRAQKLESLAILAVGIAHDFNNVLTGILGNISLARMYEILNDDVLKSLNEAEKGVSGHGN